MPDILFDARVRAQRYWYRDGLSEMVVGIVSLLQGGWILFNHLVNSKSSWYLPGALICLLLMLHSPWRALKLLYVSARDGRSCLRRRGHPHQQSTWIRGRYKLLVINLQQEPPSGRTPDSNPASDAAVPIRCSDLCQPRRPGDLTREAQELASQRA